MLGYFPRFIDNVKRAPNSAEAILAIGGWADSAGDTYSKLVNDVDKRANFIKEAITFLQKYQFDGLSIDWQYPVCWQSRCSDGQQSDKAAYTQFLKEIKEAFQPYGLKLMASISGHHAIVDNAYELNMIGQYLDIVNVMTYDYFGYWDQETGHHSPLKPIQGQNEKLSSVSTPNRMNWAISINPFFSFNLSGIHHELPRCPRHSQEQAEYGHSRLRPDIRAFRVQQCRRRSHQQGRPWCSWKAHPASWHACFQRNLRIR